jgi:uncharacterized membrane protein
MIAISTARLSLSTWLPAAALGGLAWNAFGIAQFATAVTATTETLMAGGMTAEQAAVMTSHPAWMTAAFATGVFAGLVGCALLLFRHRLAAPVLLVSLVAYCALWIGDAVHGVFAALGMSQVAVLTLVVAIAGALYFMARRTVADGRRSARQ